MAKFKPQVSDWEHCMNDVHIDMEESINDLTDLIRALRRKSNVLNSMRSVSRQEKAEGMQEALNEIESIVEALDKSRIDFDSLMDGIELKILNENVEV